MKMALSEFVLREKGIYGILHVIILIKSGKTRRAA